MKTVLIVEDDLDILESARELLEHENYQIVTAANGEDALLILRQGFRPSVILLDLMMPVMNGWDFLEAKHQDPELRDIPVIIVSSAGGATKPASEHWNAYADKPIKAAELLDLIQSYARVPMRHSAYQNTLL